MQGWKCPNCGKAHAPHVETCPEPNTDCIGKPVKPGWVPGRPAEPGWWPGKLPPDTGTLGERLRVPNAVDPFRFGHGVLIAGRSPTDMIWN